MGHGTKRAFYLYVADLGTVTNYTLSFALNCQTRPFAEKKRSISASSETNAPFWWQCDDRHCFERSSGGVGQVAAPTLVAVSERAKRVFLMVFFLAHFLGIYLTAWPSWDEALLGREKLWCAGDLAGVSACVQERHSPAGTDPGPRIGR